MTFHGKDGGDFDLLQKQYRQLLSWLVDMQGGEQFFPSREEIWTYIMRHGLLGSGEINEDGTPNSFWSYVVQSFNIQPSDRGYWRTGSRGQIKHHQDGWTLAFNAYQMNCLLRLAKQTEHAEDPQYEWNEMIAWRFPDWNKQFSGIR